MAPERVFCNFFSVVDGMADNEDHDLVGNAKRSSNNYKRYENEINEERKKE